MTLYGIDVSSNQPKSIVADVPNDFAIVKVSGNPRKFNWDYVNPYAEQQARDAVDKHGNLGLYHFTWGRDATDEARFFMEHVRRLGYVGRAVLVIDYEDEATKLGRGWVHSFAQEVERLAGYRPVIYASGSVVVGQGLLDLGYPIWCANYYKGYEPIYGYDTSGCRIYRGCEGSVLWQYTSQGHLDGYGGPLDCNVFFGTRDDWTRLAGGGMIKRNIVAVQIMRHLCECPSHGYSQPGRQGTSGYCDVDTDAGPKKVRRGDRDCSSATSQAWEIALQGTPYEGIITSRLATYTMRDAFMRTGLFEWRPTSFHAEPGDLYLSESHHVAMCIQNDGSADLLGEFFLDEHGGIDGTPGDQTGWESRITGYYDFPWDGILHYNGKADTEDDMTPEQASQLKFIYDHMHWDERTHFSDMGNLIAEFPIEYETVDEKGKKQPLTQPLGKRLGFIDQRVHVIEANQASIEKKLDAVLKVLQAPPSTDDGK